MSDRSDAEPRSADTGAAAAPTRSPRIAFQLPAFAAVGFSGFVVDAAITYLGAKYLGL